MLVGIEGSLRARFLGQEEFDGVGRRTTIVTTGEKNWNVYSEDVATRLDKA